MISQPHGEPSASVTKTIRIQVLYQDPLVAAGLVATLREHPGFEVWAASPMAGEASAWAVGGRADVVVADYEQGLALIANPGSKASPQRVGAPKVLIVSRRETQWEVRRALEQGALGYLILGFALGELIAAVRSLARGDRYIGALVACRLADSVACELPTGREIDVLRLVVTGLGNKAIAKQLGIAIGTVKAHLRAIFQKLDATSRTEAAAVAERRGLLA